MYKLIYNPIGEINVVLRVADRTSIPFDPANRDYADYLAWLAEGNTPIEADA